jgi:hypothetical protein
LSSCQQYPGKKKTPKRGHRTLEARKGGDKKKGNKREEEI